MVLKMRTTNGKEQAEDSPGFGWYIRAFWLKRRVVSARLVGRKSRIKRFLGGF